MIPSRRIAMKHGIALAATALASVSMPAHAFFGLGGPMIVFDPTNWAETFFTAKRAIETVQALTKANLAEFAFNATFGSSPEMNQMLQILDGANQMANAITDGQRALNDLTNAFGASPFDNWAGFIGNIQQRRDAGDRQARNLLDSSYAADKQIKAAYEVNRRIQQSAVSVNGPTEAAQAMVNAVGVLIDQNNNMLYGVSASNKSQAQEVTRQAAEREQIEKAQKKYRDDVKDIIQRDTRLLNGMGIRITP